MRGAKECPFSAVTDCGIVWRKVPENEARSVAGSVRVTRDLHTRGWIGSLPKR